MVTCKYEQETTGRHTRTCLQKEKECLIYVEQDIKDLWVILTTSEHLTRTFTSLSLVEHDDNYKES